MRYTVNIAVELDADDSAAAEEIADGLADMLVIDSVYVTDAFLATDPEPV